MADKAHPYISSSSALIAAITQFRKSFPSKVNAETLKKLAIAPNNESYLINILRFIGVIDEEGKRTPKADEVFSKHEDTEFKKAFEALIKSAYGELFELHKEGTWNLPGNSLISFFRTTDKSTDVVGRRQANTFLTLSSFAGHGEVPPVVKAPSAKTREPKTRIGVAATPKDTEAKPSDSGTSSPPKNGTREVGLTVRIEVNLPAAARPRHV